MIITLQPGYSIPPLIEKSTYRKILNNTAIHLYKTSTTSTRNRAIDSQRNHYHKAKRGGHKRLYRKFDFRRNEKDISGRIVTIEYGPNRNAYIYLIHYGDGEKRYILHPRGAIIGDTIESGTGIPISMENALPLSEV
ncbi:putative ribosomal protein L2 [Dioscorea sansibarensis]